MQRSFLLAIILAFCAAPLAGFADEHEDAGNRYDLDGKYASEISASAAYLATNPPRGFGKGKNSAVIIDVRTLEEYVGGHPPGAYSIPYPHIHNRGNKPVDGINYITEYIGRGIASAPSTPAEQEEFDKAFVAAVDALGLPKDAQIITMCRTGFRSVGAANLLAEAGYENVQNMWEGFKGMAKTNTAGDKVDLDGDGFVTDSDPFSGDLDGWANFAGLPVSYELKHWQLYAPYMDFYYQVAGER
jgi:rhodanese-related sulfurtransferase